MTASFPPLTPTLARSPSPLLFRLRTLFYSLTLAFIHNPLTVLRVLLTHLTPLRPHARWTLTQHLVYLLAQASNRRTTAWELAPPPSEAERWSIPAAAKRRAGKDLGVKAVRIEAAGEEWVKGEAKHALVEPQSLPGFWVWTKKGGEEGEGTGKAKEGEKVVLYLHGGGYIRERSLSMPFAFSVARGTGYRVLAPEYRLSLSPTTGHPAPLLDALAAYLHLTRTLSFDPRNILLAGDSAGANLSSALLLYLSSLRSSGADIAFPGSVALVSPWVDLTSSHPSVLSKYPTDFLPRMHPHSPLVTGHARHFPGHLASPYFSPALPTTPSALFEPLAREGVRVWVQVGGAEMLRDEGIAYAHKLREAGVDVELSYLDEEVHDAVNLHRPSRGATEDLVRAVRGLLAATPAPPPEAVLADRFPDSALDDASDEEVDAEAYASSSAVPRRFSRKQSRGATNEEVGGLFTPAERRASRRASQRAAVEGVSPLRRGSSVREKERRPSSVKDRRPSVNAGGGVGVAGLEPFPPAITALRKEPDSLSARRPSRTSAIISEEACLGAAAVGREESIKEEELTPAPSRADMSIEEPEDPRMTGTIGSARGMTVLCVTCMAQCLDNVYMTGVNIALPHIGEELGLAEGSLTWLVSAYTLTFGGFLLLAGVFADRYGRTPIFCAGMAWMSIFTIAVGVGKTDIQCIIFRALQGLGAAATVPSAIGVLSNFFVGKERHRALSMFGAAGAVGFVLGLILGGLLSGTLGWRYLFYITGPVIFGLAVIAWFSFPKERKHDGPKPALDFLGAGLGTSGMILLTFALSQSEVSGWKSPMIVAPLIVSVLAMLAFAYAEKKVKNAIMPLYLWKLPSFAGIWCSGFLLYTWWASVVYYLTLIAQEVLLISPLGTALRFAPMGLVGFVVSMSMGRAVEHFPIKPLLVGGLGLCAVAPLPAAFLKADGNFWAFVFPTSMLGVAAVSIAYNVASIALVSAVPPGAKSLAGGLINTAFQIGSGVGLAITSVVSSSVVNKHPESEHGTPSVIMEGYSAALFTTCGLAGLAFLLSLFAIRGGQQATTGMMVAH